MTRNTAATGYEPGTVTVTQALGRLEDIRGLMRDGDVGLAEVERTQLYLDILYSLAHSWDFSHKRDMRKLAGIGLDAFRVEPPS